MQRLELLAPARTAQIGIAAIDCGADAVYIAGPSFGARQAAGNSVEDIARLCDYAHQYGVRIYVTVNTIVYEQELKQVKDLIHALACADVDALIIQDPAVLEMARAEGLICHASTQCAIRNPETARFTESLGYGRLVLERQLSLDQVKAIREFVDAELEFFVHGALCVCYSGQCYLSEYLTGRSANRGECAQACRSRYDLVDANGKVLLRNKALLSLKDYNLLHRLEDLANAGVCSFKIEGRLKSEAYVRNVVSAYSQAMDVLVSKYPDKYARASFGRVAGGFVPDLDKTFNRDYTELFIDGTRGKWSSMDVPTHLGEYVGEVAKLTPAGFVLKSSAVNLSNGDGFAFVHGSEVVGFRADVADGLNIRCRYPGDLKPGTKLYRNISAQFIRQMDAAKPLREIEVDVQLVINARTVTATATSEDGRIVSQFYDVSCYEPAKDNERMLSVIRGQLAKRSGHYCFTEPAITLDGQLPYMPSAFLNGIRRDLAAALDNQPVNMIPLRAGIVSEERAPEELTYKANIANSLDRSFYESRGTEKMEQAYELSHLSGAELMRSKYCVRNELGLCPKQKPGIKPEPLYLLNAGKRLRLDFHCKECEMTVKEDL